MAHTPGEWTVDAPNAFGAYGVWSGPWQICSVLTESFCVSDGPEHTAERNANAKLIAAAPDLLNVAKLTDDYPEINFNNYDETDVSAVQAWAFRLIDAARATIAKATGKETE